MKKNNDMSASASTATLTPSPVHQHQHRPLAEDDDEEEEEDGAETLGRKRGGSRPSGAPMGLAKTLSQFRIGRHRMRRSKGEC